MELIQPMTLKIDTLIDGQIRLRIGNIQMDLPPQQAAAIGIDILKRAGIRVDINTGPPPKQVLVQ